MKVETPQQLQTSHHWTVGHRGVFVRVLVIEDEAKVASFIQKGLQQEQYAVDVAHDGEEGAYQAENFDYDVVILDLMLPKTSGLSLLRSLRAKKPSLPVLILTAKGSVGDRVKGLDSGADDYLAKPFEPRELLARLRSILRRAKGDPKSEVLRFGRLDIDAGARQVRLGGEPCALTSYQFALLLGLAQHAGRVMSREALMDIVKNERLEAFDRSIDVHISRIRAAIEDDPKKPRRIITVRGAGYVFAKAQE